MSFTTILYERRGHAACITLNRPDKLDAINYAMMYELDQVHREAEADPEVWTLIVTEAGTRRWRRPRRTCR